MTGAVIFSALVTVALALLAYDIGYHRALRLSAHTYGTLVNGLGEEVSELRAEVTRLDSCTLQWAGFEPNGAEVGRPRKGR